MKYILKYGVGLRNKNKIILKCTIRIKIIIKITFNKNLLFK